MPPLPENRPKILVTGQVEDDAAVLRTRADPFANADLLRAAREDNPGASIVFKMHPDVEAGLRRGRVQEADRWADIVIGRADPAALLDAVDEVWTISSTLASRPFCAGVPVTCLGGAVSTPAGASPRKSGRCRRAASRGPTSNGLSTQPHSLSPLQIDPVRWRALPPGTRWTASPPASGSKPARLLGAIQKRLNGVRLR